MLLLMGTYHGWRMMTMVTHCEDAIFQNVGDDDDEDGECCDDNHIRCYCVCLVMVIVLQLN